ncbi:MAG: DUF6069 family protein [Gaiellales bacterium]
MTSTTRRRLATVAAAPAAAVAAWAGIRAAGVSLGVSTGGTVGAGSVIVVAVLAALGGWLVVRVVERHSANPRARWAQVATTVLAVSMIGPSWTADGAAAVALMSLHFVVAVVVIGGFMGSLPAPACRRLSPEA